MNSYPRSWEEFCYSWLRGKGPFPIRMIVFIFSGFAWALWTASNRMAINKLFPQAPTDIIYTALSLLQKWSIKLKEEDREHIHKMKDAVLRWLKSFVPSSGGLSDVVEI